MNKKLFSILLLLLASQPTMADLQATAAVRGLYADKRARTNEIDQERIAFDYRPNQSNRFVLQVDFNLIPNPKIMAVPEWLLDVFWTRKKGDWTTRFGIYRSLGSFEFTSPINTLTTADRGPQRNLLLDRIMGGTVTYASHNLTAFTAANRSRSILENEAFDGYGFQYAWVKRLKNSDHQISYGFNDHPTAPTYSVLTTAHRGWWKEKLWSWKLENIAGFNPRAIKNQVESIHFADLGRKLGQNFQLHQRVYYYRTDPQSGETRDLWQWLPSVYFHTALWSPRWQLFSSLQYSIDLSKRHTLPIQNSLANNEWQASLWLRVDHFVPPRAESQN